MADIQTVGVLGCGLMGGGIAQVCATAGFETRVREINQEFLDRGVAGIERQLDSSVERGRIDQAERDAIRARLHPTTDLADFADCDIVIEAVTEDLDVKREIFGELDKVAKPEAIFASNTSSLTIAAIAPSTTRGDRFVGMHFFYPAPAMQLVEVVRTVTTSDESFERAYAFGEAIGKQPIRTKDQSGFIVNLLLVPYLLDAIRQLERGIGSIEEIDRGMQLGCGHPMGPFVLLDFIGLDTVYHIANIMFDEYREARYGPPPLLKRMVLNGMYGRKSGKGFYDYAEKPPTPSSLGI